jgi:predicted O-methyltransferase YrrM
LIPEIANADWRPDIPGWSEDILPLYRRIARELPHESRFVEVGVAHGRSLIFLAEELHELHRRDVEIWGVDSWPGDWWRKSIARTFEHNDLAGYVWDTIRLVRADETRAARMFDDGSLDVAFVDSDHTEAGVEVSIATWLPKVKQGGLLCGHDYDVSAWPGVVAAVKRWEERLGPVGRPTRTCWEWRIR